MARRRFDSEPDAQFLRFWAMYPRKVSRLDALKAWADLKPTEALVEHMIDALAWQCNQPGWTKDGGTWVPYPGSWLRGRRWEDEPFHTPLSPLGRRKVPDDEPL